MSEEPRFTIDVELEAGFWVGVVRDNGKVVYKSIARFKGQDARASATDWLDMHHPNWRKETVTR